MKGGKNMNETKEFKVIISWSWEDIKEIRPSWDKEKCLDRLRYISRGLSDSSIEHGWEFLDICLEEDK